MDNPLSVDDLIHFTMGLYECLMSMGYYNFTNQEANEMYCWRLSIDKSVAAGNYHGSY